MEIAMVQMQPGFHHGVQMQPIYHQGYQPVLQQGPLTKTAYPDAEPKPASKNWLLALLSWAPLIGFLFMVYLFLYTEPLRVQLGEKAANNCVHEEPRYRKRTCEECVIVQLRKEVEEGGRWNYIKAKLRVAKSLGDYVSLIGEWATSIILSHQVYLDYQKDDPIEMPLTQLACCTVLFMAPSLILLRWAVDLMDDNANQRLIKESAKLKDARRIMKSYGGKEDLDELRDGKGLRLNERRGTDHDEIHSERGFEKDASEEPRLVEVDEDANPERGVIRYGQDPPPYTRFA